MTRITATPDTLNTQMDFHSVYLSYGDGTISHEMKLDGPSLEGETIWTSASESEPWTLLSGFTGQQSYNGPVMHSSECLGGDMAKHVLETPGLYCVVVIEDECDYDGTTECTLENGCDCEAVGWALAYKDDTLEFDYSEGN